ncbi:hypothetical protein [Spirosoma sp. KUDC1026]|uniref:hypothetical protein n=1 Tax=Spirosoma sp. KUDC1026 TaxID=2745947 RepID=UPI00159BA8A8|nr:hypothetical protein [Spirosoma sp. KUDC1026]QKZ13616.1 hypothetical protein HU175_13635 [Spirosoma sp. KUDC1026]
MNNQRQRALSAHVAWLGLFVAALLSACSKPESVDSVALAPDQYVLKDIRYFVAPGDRVDTTTLQLKGSSVQNTGSVLATRQVEESFGGLVKTSQFTLDPTTQLPQEVDLNQYAVSVPEHWYGNNRFDRSIDTYPLSTIEQQKPYGFGQKSTLTVNIPPRSKIDISHQITVYRLTCSFEGNLENVTTGQRYQLKGNWAGILQYANPTTLLKESTL